MTRYGYIRTSKNTQNLDRQIHQLKGVCDELFIEDGVSARKKNRPVYQKVLSLVKPGDEIVVLSYDRAFRSVVEGLASLDRLTEHGVKLQSLSQKIDPTTPDGRLFFTMTMAVGEWEVNILSWRTTQGIQAARRRGKTIGRPRKDKLLN